MTDNKNVCPTCGSEIKPKRAPSRMKVTLGGKQTLNFPAKDFNKYKKYIKLKSEQLESQKADDSADDSKQNS